MSTHPEGLREAIDASVERWADLYPTPDVVTHIADDVTAWLAEHDAKVRAEALREVRDAWTRAGRMPTHHHRLKNQLRRDWPVLAGALDRIEREAR